MNAFIRLYGCVDICVLSLSCLMRRTVDAGSIVNSRPKRWIRGWMGWGMGAVNGMVGEGEWGGGGGAVELMR